MKPTSELPVIADDDLAQATGGNLLQTIGSWLSSGSQPTTGGSQPTTGGNQPAQPAPCRFTDGRRYSRTLCPNGPR